jgi:hypothetical protein
MRKRGLTSVGLMVLAVLFLNFSLQDDFMACKKELKKYVAELAKINEPMGKNVYYMRMTIKTDMNAKSNIPDSETNVEVYMSSDQLHYVSDVLSTYQDEQDAFAVLPQRKMIVWAKGGKRPDANAKKDLAIHVQDTLIELSIVTKCQVVQQAGKTLKMITMVPSKKAIEAFRVNYTEYFLDTENGRVAKVNTYYKTTEEVSMRSVTYHELNLNFKKVKLNKPVYEQIFSEPNKLSSKYKGYQLIDNR